MEILQKYILIQVVTFVLCNVDRYMREIKIEWSLKKYIINRVFY